MNYRRYRFPAGEVVVCPDRQVRFIPHWCVHISTSMERSAAAAALWELRRREKGET